MRGDGIEVDVSRETLDQLRVYHDMLLRWTASINLIAPSTKTSAWDKHIVDSAQVFRMLPTDSRHLVDLGSGGGLPGLVLSIMSQRAMPSLETTLVESDQRKVAFLRSVIRELDLSAEVICQRIEAVTGLAGDVVTARALASLDQLLTFIAPIISPDGVALLLKGRQAPAEIEAARRLWTFDLISHVSRTDPDARILQIKDIRHAIA